MNPYQTFVPRFTKTIDVGKPLPLGGFTPAPKPPLAGSAPKALFFSPHPDDECISGGIAVRLLRDAKMNVVNVAVTQGRKKAREAERLRELEGACKDLCLGAMATGPNGWEAIHPSPPAEESTQWSPCLK